MKFRGLRHVFGFTYVQWLKSKSFKVATLIMALILVLIALGVNFIPLLGDGEGFALGAQTTGVEEIHLLDKSETFHLNLDFLEDLDITVHYIQEKDLEQTRETVRQSDNAEILMLITKGEDGYKILTERPESSKKVSTADCARLNLLFIDELFNSILLSGGLDEDILELTKTPINHAITIAGQEEQSPMRQAFNHIAPLFISFFFFMLIFAYASTVAYSIAQEKTSRVIELLLTSIAPLAIISGKILAAFLVSLTQFLVLYIVSVTSYTLAAPFGIFGKLAESQAETSTEATALAGELNAALSGIDPYAGLKVLVVFLLGFLFFSLISGLVGASVSRAEDLQAAMQPLSLIAVFGFYFAFFPRIFDWENNGALTAIANYLPLSSPFSLPADIISGSIDNPTFLTATAILLLSNILMLALISRVYERVILYTGTRLGIRGILKLF
ncbi:MAG: ABC transporter permease [Oscillospiraceae bacterium]|nr:ABC transporter permease [Oscillospiraceae bacterium]